MAILYDRLSYMVGGSQPSLSNLGNAERDSLLGMYRAFFEKQIPVDFVDPVAHERAPRQYKILFLPYAVMLSRGVASVKEYISGGTVVAEARLAWNDERGFASPVIPGFGLDECSARAKSHSAGGGTELGDSRSPTFQAWPRGKQFPGRRSKRICSRCRRPCLGEFSLGDAAMVENAYGQGKAILIGSFLGLAYQRTHDAATRGFAGYCAEAHRKRGRCHEEVEVRQLMGDGQQFVFVFNHASAPADAAIALRLPWELRTARDLVSGDAAAWCRIRSAGTLRRTTSGWLSWSASEAPSRAGGRFGRH